MVVEIVEYDFVIVDHVFDAVKCRFVVNWKEIASQRLCRHSGVDYFVVPEDDVFENH